MHRYREAPWEPSAQLSLLGAWLDIDPDDLDRLSPASLAALTERMESGRSDAATIAAQSAALIDVQKTADTDSLTGVASRRAIDRRLDTEWHRGIRHEAPVTVLLVDIDDLKVINDSEGHPGGDRVIVDVAHRLAGALRGEDQVGRVGGDEYMIVCPETDAESARAIAARLINAVETVTVEDDHRRTRVRISIGWASTSTPHASVRDLVAAADAHLYRGKRQNKRRVV